MSLNTDDESFIKFTIKMSKTMYPPPNISSLITGNFSKINDLNKEMGKESQILELLNQTKQEMENTYQKMSDPKGTIAWYNLKIGALRETFLDYHSEREVDREPQTPYVGQN